jgi:hypothetical protein
MIHGSSRRLLQSIAASFGVWGFLRSSREFPLAFELQFWPRAFVCWPGPAEPLCLVIVCLTLPL